MPPPAPLARHAAAGRIDPVRVALRTGGGRVGEPLATGPPGADGSLVSGPLVSGRQHLGGCVLDLGIDAADESVAVDLALRNASEQPVALASVLVGVRWRAPRTQGLRYLRHGWQSWSFTGSRDLDDAGPAPFPSGPWLRGMFHATDAPPDDRRGWHESDGLTVIGDARGGVACLAGVLERGRSFGVVYLRRDPDGIALEVELRLDARLAPGAVLEPERVRLALGEDAWSLLEEFAEEQGRAGGARTRAPFQSGWCSWYHFFHDVSESDLLRNLDALVAARHEIPVRVVQLDDGYQGAIGDWLAPNERFPRGVAPLASAIRAAGFEAGIWTAPFCVAPDSGLFRSVAHWCLRQGEGPLLGLLHPQWTPTARIHVLDASRPEVRAHLESLFRELADMGFRYQKLDFLYTAAMTGRAFDPALPRAARLRAGLDAIRAGAGADAFLLGCGCPLGAAVGVVDGMRIGPDVAPHWGVRDDPPIPGIEDTRPATRNALRSIVNRAFMHRRLWLNDPDCLMLRETGTDLAPGEARTLAAAVAATGGMVLLSDDVPSLGAGSRALLATTLRLAREVDDAAPVGVARVPGILEREFPAEVRARVPGALRVAFLNAGEQDEVQPLAGIASDAAPPEPVLASAPEPARDDRARIAARGALVLRARRGPPFAVFCDFDGTFVEQDVGSTLAQRHGGAAQREAWARLERGECTAWEYTRAALDGLPVDAPKLDRFLREEITLDPGARALVKWCQDHDVAFRVLSDGFEPNIARLQELHGVWFPFDANRLALVDGRWRIAAALPGLDCGCGTGNCKRRRIEAHRRAHPGVTLLHVGNGRISDLCGARAADVAFAKGSLAAVMERAGEAFEPFETLRDVERWLAARVPERPTSASGPP